MHRGSIVLKPDSPRLAVAHGPHEYVWVQVQPLISLPEPKSAHLAFFHFALPRGICAFHPVRLR